VTTGNLTFRFRRALETRSSERTRTDEYDPAGQALETTFRLPRTTFRTPVVSYFATIVRRVNPQAHDRGRVKLKKKK